MDGEYVENTDKPWRSTYSHQRRPDVTARAARMIPRDRLVTKTGRFFSTDTSQEKLDVEIDEQEERRAAEAGFDVEVEEAAPQTVVKPKKQFTPKHSNGKR